MAAARGNTSRVAKSRAVFLISVCSGESSRSMGLEI